MSILTKLHINESVLNILKYKLSVTQNADYTGRPSSKSVVQPIEITYETIKNDPFYDKMISGNITDYLKLVIAPVLMHSKTTTIELLDFYVLEQHEIFDGVNSKPMTSHVKISFASLVVNGVVMDVKYWRENDPNVKMAVPTVIREQEDEEILDAYYEDEQGNRIDKPKVGTIVKLIVKTRNAIGKIIEIDLNDNERDFMYKDKILDADILKLQIKQNNQKEELTIIAQNH